MYTKHRLGRLFGQVHNLKKTPSAIPQRAAMATQSQIQTLQKYTACDISDSLLKLKVPNCGFLPDLNAYHTGKETSPTITIAPASTVLFVPRNNPDLTTYPETNIPAGKHWVDLTESGSFVVMSQPKGQICACLGGIMALRMSVVGAKGVIANGRLRDLDELRDTDLTVS